MKLTFKFAIFSCAALTSLAAAGCKITECTETTADGGTVKKENCVQVEPTVEYRDARVRMGGEAWVTGRPVSITNRNGPVKVAVGGDGDERVAFSGIAFTRETNNDQGAQKAKDRLGAMANPAFSTGDYVALVAPGGGFDGYDLTVWLPKDFNAALTVVTDNGTTTLYGTEGATSTTVTSHEIIATDLRRAINLHAKVGKIDFGGTLNGPGNVVQADLGDIVARIGSASNLGITAKTGAGMVNFPTAWSQTVNPDRMAGSATLGDGTGTLSVNTDNGSINFYAQ